MKTEIIVTNPLRVRKVIGTNKENLEELKHINDPKVKKFLKKNKDVFNSYSPSEMKKFYNETGLHITRIISENYSTHTLCIDQTGIFYDDKNHKLSNNRYGDEYLIFKDDIQIVDHVDLFNENYRGLFINNKKYIYNLRGTPINNISYIDILHKPMNEISVDEKIKYIKEIDEHFFDDIDEKKIIRIFQMYPFNEIYTLLDNGQLYEDNRIYCSDVKDLWSLNIAHIFVIHNDNTIDFLKHSFLRNYEKKYKKILYGNWNFNEYFACLDCNDNLAIYNSFNNDSNRYIYNSFKNVDDIEFNEELQSLTLIKGEEKIEFFSGFTAEY